MTQLQFNLDLDSLKKAVIKSNIETVVRSAIVLVLNEYMQSERDGYLQAASYQRSSDRLDFRNVTTNVILQ